MWEPSGTNSKARSMIVMVNPCWWASSACGEAPSAWRFAASGGCTQVLWGVTSSCGNRDVEGGVVAAFRKNAGARHEGNAAVSGGACPHSHECGYTPRGKRSPSLGACPHSHECGYDP